MGWFRSKGELQAVNQMNQMLVAAFQHVKQDVYHVYSWLRYLHQQNMTFQQQIAVQQRVIQDLQEHLRLIPRTPEQIRELIDKYYDHQALLHRIQSMESEISDLRARPLQAHPVQSAQPIRQTSMNLRDKIVRNVTRNSKEYVKGLILQAIQKYSKISGLQLREIFVEEQNLVSRSSFYRLLNELEQEAGVSVVQDGKEKVYIASVPQKEL